MRLIDCYTYRQGVRFGLVKPGSQKVEFYFEKISKTESTRCAIGGIRHD